MGEVQMFGDPTPTNTEGIVFDAEGSLYVSAQDRSGPDQLLDVAVDGTYQSIAEADSILGLESDERGILGAGIRTENLLLFDPSDGGNEEVATGLGEPNFVVTTPWDTILVSDDRRGVGSILEVTWDGEVSVWSEEVPTPNGMVFSLDGSWLYVAATFEEAGLWRIPVSDETAGAAEKWVAYDTSAPDGVAIDSEGNVYVALNTAGQIAKVDTEGSSTTLADEFRGVGPASIAFGQGDFDPCSLYVTSLFTPQMYRVGAGVLGVEK
jgi:sugar lactone lactonase YvrE